MGNNDSYPLRECIINDATYFLPKNFKNGVVYSEGGQGKVIKATDKNTKQKIAIKKISLVSSRTGAIPVSSTKNAYRELALLGLVKHPNIISLLHAYTPNSTISTFKELYLVMPFVSDTLQNRLDTRSKQFTDAEILKFIYGILNGLDYLHKFEIVHRDLKPKNIGINENGDPVIFDFGLARLNTVNSITNGAGTLVYVAPEIFINIKCPDRVIKADIWSLGCIWIEMINRKGFVKNIECYFDYWPKLLELLGTPDDGFMNKIPEFFRLLLAKSYPTYPAKKWEELIPTENFCESVRSNEEHIDAVRTVISNMLKYDPEKRPSAKELISQFEQNNWCEKNTVAYDPIKIERFKRTCDDAKRNEMLWKKLLFERVKYCTTLLKFPLHKACFHSNVDEFPQLLDTTKSSLDAKDSDGDTPLNIAVWNNSVEIVCLPLENGACVNKKDGCVNILLHYAARYNSVDCASLLLEHADMNAKLVENTPLYYAVRNSNIECAQLLLEEEADMNAIDRYHRTPISFSEGERNEDMIQLLKEYQPRPSTSNQNHQ